MIVNVCEQYGIAINICLTNSEISKLYYINEQFAGFVTLSFYCSIAIYIELQIALLAKKGNS